MVSDGSYAYLRDCWCCGAKVSIFARNSHEPFLTLFVALAHGGSSGRRNMCCVFGDFASLTDVWGGQNGRFVSAAGACCVFLTLFPMFGGLQFRMLFTAFPPDLASEWLVCHFRRAGGFEFDAICRRRCRFA